MTFQLNASGTFQEDNWYTWHIYLIIAFGCLISHVLQGIEINNVTETR
jgi:hypothetical protein